MPDTARYLVAYTATGDMRHIVATADLHASPQPPAALCSDREPRVRRSAYSSIGVSANSLATLVAALPLAAWCAGCLEQLSIPAPAPRP